MEMFYLINVRSDTTKNRAIECWSRKWGRIPATSQTDPAQLWGIIMQTAQPMSLQQYTTKAAEVEDGCQPTFKRRIVGSAEIEEKAVWPCLGSELG
jgi:hypothetical protein